MTLSTNSRAAFKRCAHCLYCSNGIHLWCALALTQCANVQTGQCLVCDTDWSGEDWGAVAQWRMSITRERPQEPDQPTVTLMMDYTQLTEVLRISHSVLTNWVKRGLPYVPSDKGRRYDSAVTRDWISKNIRHSRILANAAQL